MVAAYCGAVAAAVATTTLQGGQLRLFAVLAACGVVTAGLARRANLAQDGASADPCAIWDLPIAVLLPPAYSLLAPVPRMIVSPLLTRPGEPLRPAGRAAASALAYGIASLVFHAAVPALGSAPVAGTGGRAIFWTALVAACGVLRLAALDPLTRLPAAPAPGTPPPAVLGKEMILGNLAEVSLGTLSAVSLAQSTLTIVLLAPLVLVMQRSLQHAKLVSECRIDGKTSLLNDATWRREAAREIARAARTGGPLAIALVDVDNFKQVNDIHGHPAGDAVLASIAAAMRNALRPYDVLGRVGGEEFAIALPGIPAAEAIEVAERLRATIASMTTAPAGAQPPGPLPTRVTVSIGVATADRPGWDLPQYYNLADHALLAAKRSGRNAVWVITRGPRAPLIPRRACPAETAAARSTPGNP